MKNLTLGAMVLSVLAVQTHAQAVETNPAKLVLGAPKASLSPLEVLDINDDPTPFGVDLSGIIVQDKRLKADALTPALRADLAPLVGQPLSFQLLSKIQAAITEHYRGLGRPLVSVTIPPQEISDGNVSIDVTTFVLNTKKVAGETRAPDGFILNQVRLEEGQEINADILVEDLNWLNLNPFRKVQGIFEPGKGFGTTNVILEIEEDRPWSAFAGLANSGSASTGSTRVFAGFNTAALPFPDHQLAYQFTTSLDTLKNGEFFKSGTQEPGYVSHAATYFAPLTFANGTRMKVTAQAYFASSYSAPTGLIATQSDTSGVSLELAFPLAKQGRDFTFFPEAYAKLDYKQKEEDLFFSGAQVGVTDTKARQIAFGMRANTFGDIFGKKSQGSIDAHIILGKTTLGNNPDISATVFKVNARQSVGLSDAVTLSGRLNAQASSDNLSSLDQFGIGGAGSVRGYDTNEASAASGLSIGFEVSGKPVALSDSGVFPISMSPYGFLDAGYVRPTPNTPSRSLGSIGVGGQFTLGASAFANIEAAYTLKDGPSTRKGSSKVHFNLTAQF